MQLFPNKENKFYESRLVEKTPPKLKLTKVLTMIKLTEEEWILLGLELAGHEAFRVQPTCQKTNQERFTSHYFANVKTVVALFDEIHLM